MKIKKYNITDAELEIMKVLWEKGSLTLNNIVEVLSDKETKNKSTIKTLLYRLIDKQAVNTIQNANKENLYTAAIDKEKFLKKENDNFLKKLYNGNTNKLLLNFIEEEKITKKDLEDLINLIDNEE